MADDGVPEPPSVTDILTRAAITASPKLAGSALVLYEGFRDRRAARAQEVLGLASANVSTEYLHGRLAANDRLDVLVANAIEAGARTSLTNKRRLLGRVVNEAILDDALIDEAELIVGVLSQIDAPHVRCLEDVHRAEEVARAAGEVPARAQGAERPLVSTIVDVGRRHSGPVVTVLRSLGLLDAGGTDDAMLVKGVTGFGRLLLNDLHDDARANNHH